MLLYLGLGLLGVGAYLFSQDASASDGGSMNISPTRLYNLPDVSPDDQGGSYKRDFDFYFEAAADEFAVPFALLKAHAFRESSFRDKAYRDENPNKLTSRDGWASRGLMQLLFWPGSTRFEKYGFSASRNPDDLYNPQTNIRIAAQLIRDNLNACDGNVKDAINMYNAGVKYSKRPAPDQYTEKVLSYYSTLVGKEIT